MRLLLALVVVASSAAQESDEFSFVTEAARGWEERVSCSQYTEYTTCDKDDACNWCGIKGCIVDCHYKCYTLDEANHLKDGACDKPTAPTPAPGPTPAPVPTPPPPTPPPTPRPPDHYGDPKAHPCLSDEIQISITNVSGAICSPSCSAVSVLMHCCCSNLLTLPAFLSRAKHVQTTFRRI